MVGHKTRSGPIQEHQKYFYKEREYKPCRVTVKKLYSTGSKAYMSASATEGGDLIFRNHRPIPWAQINWD
jgi:hypothetical protein